MSDEQLIEQFEKEGVLNVRARLVELTWPVKTEALEWLAKKDSEENLRNESMRASQMSIALSSKMAAWVAAVFAIIAAFAAIINLIIDIKK
jgi:hypothetical protein